MLWVQKSTYLSNIMSATFSDFACGYRHIIVSCVTISRYFESRIVWNYTLDSAMSVGNTCCAFSAVSKKVSTPVACFASVCVSANKCERHSGLLE